MPLSGGMIYTRSAFVLYFGSTFLVQDRPSWPSFTGRPTLPALTFGEVEDRLLCPVRVLLAYTRHVQPLRVLNPSPRLFVSHKPGFVGDIAPGTQSR